MKFQKVMAMFGLSACLAGTPVLAAVAQEQPAAQLEAVSENGVQDVSVEPAPSTAQNPAPVSVQETEPEKSEPAAPADTSGGTSSTQTPDVEQAAPGNDQEQGTDENTEEEPGESTEEETGEETGESTEEETGEETGGSAEEETGEETGGSAEEETGEETGGSAEEEAGEEAGGSAEEETGEEAGGSAEVETGKETGGTAEKETGKKTDQKDNKKDTAGTKDTVSSYQKNTVTDSVKLNTVANIGDYEVSEKLLDNREKIKYNVDFPLDNIPSFITQEMIIGALKCQDETGYPASVTIAQIIQESGYGKYGPGGEDGDGLSYLAYQYNNLFGIKGMGPAGSVDMKTGEQTSDGASYTITAGFRVYNTYTECIEDRAELLGRVYKDLISDVEDANTFAVRIGSRWATDVDYGQTLIKVMERYDLYRLDEMTVGEFSDMLGTFVNPCPGAVLTSEFGYRTAPTAGATTYHKGIDLGTGAYNIPTYAAAEGTVIFAGDAGTAGMMIVIDHSDGVVTKYMHHDKIYVEEGDEVEKGQQIGLSGTTGISTGNHLHFQIEVNGQAVDPLEYLNLEENQ